MIKIERNPMPPASLAEEAKKSHGSYSGEDVVKQLKEDSNDKCYICELQGLSDPEVEHLLPHHQRKKKERVFDWNNLFWACRHCNLVKTDSRYEEKIIDCCKEDPEIYLEHVYEDNHVSVHNLTENEKAVLTADLIENCFEKRDTGIRVAACQYRIDKLAKAMAILYRTLDGYKKNPDSKRFQSSLRGMLSRKSEFSAFKRSYVRKHMTEYSELQNFLN